MTLHNKFCALTKKCLAVLYPRVLLQAREVLFQTVGEELHHGPVAGLSMCAWKPLFMTCGQLDKTVRVWNYESMTQELVKQYQQELFSATIHPTGTAPSNQNTHTRQQVRPCADSTFKLLVSPQDCTLWLASLTSYGSWSSP
jgi:HPt (histidine-containing phosphotransfer) domain-containing protein